MTSPYAISGPAMVSFSGGRTSALMLRRMLDVGLAPDVHVLFANTGKEREETLQFVHEVGTRWGVPIRWLERVKVEGEAAGSREVTFETASRKGEPFEALIGERQFLPNPVIRYCTQELKIRTMKAWMLARGYEHWTNVVGLRADEPRRVASQRATEGRERWDVSFPLFDAGVVKNDVLLFWKQQPFDLQLREWEGNCDLCFLKGIKKRTRVMEDRPDLAAWWVGQEERVGALFRADAPSYGALFRNAQSQMRMFDTPAEDPTDLGDCVCLEAA